MAELARGFAGGVERGRRPAARGRSARRRGRRARASGPAVVRGEEGAAALPVQVGFRLWVGRPALFRECGVQVPRAAAMRPQRRAPGRARRTRALAALRRPVARPRRARRNRVSESVRLAGPAEAVPRVRKHAQAQWRGARCWPRGARYARRPAEGCCRCGRRSGGAKKVWCARPRWARLVGWVFRVVRRSGALPWGSSSMAAPATRLVAAGRARGAAPKVRRRLRPRRCPAGGSVARAGRKASGPGHRLPQRSVVPPGHRRSSRAAGGRAAARQVGAGEPERKRRPRRCLHDPDTRAPARPGRRPAPPEAGERVSAEAVPHGKAAADEGRFRVRPGRCGRPGGERARAAPEPIDVRRARRRSRPSWILRRGWRGRRRARG